MLARMAILVLYQMEHVKGKVEYFLSSIHFQIVAQFSLETNFHTTNKRHQIVVPLIVLIDPCSPINRFLVGFE